MKNKKHERPQNMPYEELIRIDGEWRTPCDLL